ncbi:hypothetical protein [Clostridium sp.]|uniref:hypothetical protein n=1 Tax=Clostridium sp. TaxID=1506 RepID=UPI003217D26F
MCCNLSPEELVLAAAILAIYIAKDRTTDELNVLGNLLVGIGTNLLIVAAANPQNESTTGSGNNNSESTTNSGNNSE